MQSLFFHLRFHAGTVPVIHVSYARSHVTWDIAELHMPRNSTGFSFFQEQEKVKTADNYKETTARRSAMNGFCEQQNNTNWKYYSKAFQFKSQFRISPTD